MTKIKPGRFYALRQQTEEDNFWAFALMNIEDDAIILIEYKSKTNEWDEVIRSKSRMQLVVEIDKISVLPLHSMELAERKKVIKSVLDRTN